MEIDGDGVFGRAHHRARQLRTLLLLALGGYGTLPGSASARQDTIPAQGPSACPSGTPHRDCSAFWITEAGFTFRLRDDTVLYPSFELGRLWNGGSRMAFGLAGYVGFNDGFLVGLKPRVRTWVGRDTGLDVAVGLLCCRDGGESDFVPAGHVGLVVRDLWAVVLQVERWPAYRVDRGPYYQYDAFLGAKIGSAPGVWSGVAAAAVGVGILVWLIATLEN